MNNKAIVTTVVVLVVVILGGFGIWYWTNSVTSLNPSYTTNGNTTNQNGTQYQNTVQNQTRGTMYFSMTDAAVDMKNVTAVTMTVDNVQTYNKAVGWITVSQVPQTFSLLDLKAKHQVVLLAKASVPVGTYSEFRLHIAKIMVTASGTTKQALVPSNNFDVATNVMVNANANSAAQFDVMADKSLHQTDKGEFVFTPVVRFDSRVNATVLIGAGNVMVVSFGETNASVNLGMDVDGKIKTDFVVDPNAKLSVSGGTIHLGTAVKLGL